MSNMSEIRTKYHEGYTFFPAHLNPKTMQSMAMQNKKVTFCLIIKLHKVVPHR